MSNDTLFKITYWHNDSVHVRDTIIEHNLHSITTFGSSYDMNGEIDNRHHDFADYQIDSFSVIKTRLYKGEPTESEIKLTKDSIRHELFLNSTGDTLSSHVTIDHIPHGIQKDFFWYCHDLDDFHAYFLEWDHGKLINIQDDFALYTSKYGKRITKEKYIKSLPVQEYYFGEVHNEIFQSEQDSTLRSYNVYYSQSLGLGFQQRIKRTKKKFEKEYLLREKQLICPVESAQEPLESEE